KAVLLFAFQNFFLAVVKGQGFYIPPFGGGEREHNPFRFFSRPVYYSEGIFKLLLRIKILYFSKFFIADFQFGHTIQGKIFHSFTRSIYSNEIPTVPGLLDRNGLDLAPAYGAIIKFKVTELHLYPASYCM